MTILSSIRNSPRLAELIAALAKFGFDEFVTDVGLNKLTSTCHALEKTHLLDKRTIGQPLEVRLRLLLESLGPTYIKLGQILSTRPDLIPTEMIDELKKLQNDCPRVDFDIIRERVEDEFGESLETLFSSFESEPLAAGSLAQTHRAVLRTGEKVVVKVQRPKASKLIAADMDVLTEVAKFVEKHFDDVGYSPVKVVNEISKQLKRELDFINEGKNTEHLRGFFAGNEKIDFPRVFWKTSSRHVLTLEEIEGRLLSELNLDEVSLEVRRNIVANGADAVYRMCLESGLFHADPHPGNIIVKEKGDLCFIDCGMTGHIEDITLGNIADLVAAVLNKDLSRVIRLVIGMTQAEPELEFDREFRESAWGIVTRFHVTSLEKLDLVNLINSLFEVLRQYHIRCPADLVYLIKAMTTIQGVGQQVDPSFDIVSYVNPMVHQLVARQYGLGAMKDRLIRGFVNYADLLEKLPNELRALIMQFHRRHFKIRLQHDELSEFTRTVGFSSKLLACAMIISAIIIGSANLFRMAKWELIADIGVVALVVGCAFCIVLMIDIFRDRK